MHNIEIERNIEDLIFEIRGVQVMLASEVAMIYHVETKVLNQTIKRNISRFPETFCFQLTEKEYSNLRSQIVTSSENNHGGIRYLPYVLTEQGIMMLSGLLKSDIATSVNIQIIDAFVKIRRYISNSLVGNEIILDHENRILKLENTFNKIEEKSNHIFFDGQIYDAYSLLVDILKESEDEIIMIDNYIDKSILDITCLIDKK